MGKSNKQQKSGKKAITARRRADLRRKVRFGAAGLGLIVLGGLGVVGGLKGNEALRDSRKISLNRLVAAANADTAHSVKGPYAESLHSSRGMNLVFEGPTDFCARCHTAGDLDNYANSHSTALQAYYEAIRRRYPVHSDIRDALVVFNPGKLRTDAGSDASALTGYFRGDIQFKLSDEVQPVLPEFSDPHEIFHFACSNTDDFLKELWAHAIPFSVNPKLIERIRFGKGDLLGAIHNRHTLLFLNRAAILAGKAKDTNPTAGSASAIASYGKALKARDIDKVSDVFSQAFKEYRRNSVYWDTMLRAGPPDPSVIVDIFVANRLAQDQNRDFLRQLNRTAEVEENMRLIQSNQDALGRLTDVRQNIVRHLEDYGFEQFYEQRSALFKKYEGSRTTPREIEMKYLAAIHRLMTPNGLINYGAGPELDKALRATAQDKIAKLRSALEETRGLDLKIRESMGRGQIDSQAGQARRLAIEKRTELIERRISELNSQIETNRLLIP